MPIYRTSGTLTGTIEPENVGFAQNYLQADDMTQYLDASLQEIVERIQWHLNIDGHTWYVEVFATRVLEKSDLKALSLWVSGQNSDGLGEGFEQQEFAWEESGYGDDEYDGDYENGHMISFDWETNDCKFERVK